MKNPNSKDKLQKSVKSLFDHLFNKLTDQLFVKKEKKPLSSKLRK